MLEPLGMAEAASRALFAPAERCNRSKSDHGIWENRNPPGA
jgi:hypothetical protein